MAAYVKLAEAAEYAVRFVEPSELSLEWNSIDFLLARNEMRRNIGKMLDEEVLQRMVNRNKNRCCGRVVLGF